MVDDAPPVGVESTIPFSPLRRSHDTAVRWRKPDAHRSAATAREDARPGRNGACAAGPPGRTDGSAE